MTVKFPKRGGEPLFRGAEEIVDFVVRADPAIKQVDTIALANHGIPVRFKLRLDFSLSLCDLGLAFCGILLHEPLDFSRGLA